MRPQAGDADFKARGTRIWSLTLGMIGKREDPLLHAKAAESHEVFLFSVALLEELMPQLMNIGGVVPLQASLLLEAGRAALRFNQILQNQSTRECGFEVQHELMFHYVRYCSFFVRGGGHMKPKNHMIVHIIQEMGRNGMPKFYSCYDDESLNGTVAKIAKSCHRVTFGISVFKKFNHLQSIAMGL